MTDLVLPVHGWPPLTRSPSIQRATPLPLGTNHPQSRTLLRRACPSRSRLQGSTTLHSSNSSSCLIPTRCSRLLRGTNMGLWQLSRSLLHSSGVQRFNSAPKFAPVENGWTLSHAWMHS